MFRGGVWEPNITKSPMCTSIPYSADGVIYMALHRLSMLNHEALKDASKHWMILSNKTPFLQRHRDLLAP